MVERLIKVGHLRRYIREVDHEEESAPIAGRITTCVAALPESRPAINYILGGPLDDKCQSKFQQKKLLRASTVKAQVNTVHISDSWEETKPIDDPISFPPVSTNRVIVPYYDALVLTLCINSFDVHRVLVDPGSARFVATACFRPNESFPTNVEFGWTNHLCFQRRNNHDTRRYHTSCTSRASHPPGFILSCRRPEAIQLHSWQGLTALDEGHSFNISSNG